MTTKRPTKARPAQPEQESSGREPSVREEPLALRHFVEEMGLSLEYAGMPRMAGRILGYLIVCDPPEQTAEEIARRVEASRASVSTMTRLLLNATLIEKIAEPGKRRDLYRVRPSAFRTQFIERVRLITQFREVLERGLVALEAQPEARKTRIRSMLQLYRWMEREIPLLLARFESELATMSLDGERAKREGAKREGAKREGAKREVSKKNKK